VVSLDLTEESLPPEQRPEANNDPLQSKELVPTLRVGMPFWTL
jgi:hypothetical protein